MFIPVNMTQQNIDYIVRATGMKKVSEMKHIGVIIKSNGDVTYEDNILSIETAIKQDNTYSIIIIIYSHRTINVLEVPNCEQIYRPLALHE